jgi:hypothetical protein
MRQLRFVRINEDSTQLVLHSPDGVEDFRVALDQPLREAVARAPTAQPANPTAPGAEQAEEPAGESATISPREIQLRVRSGESPEHVAQALSAPLERIMRFAAAVVDERRRITEEARRSRARQTALDSAEGKIVPFGEAVNERFTAHGISAAEVRWDSHRREDGEWVVVARWVGGTGEHEAHWVFSRAARRVTPADAAAADLLNDRPIRPVTPPPPSPRLVVAPPLVPGVVAFPPMPDAHTGPIKTVEEEVFDQEAEPAQQSDPQPLRPAFLREPRRAAQRPHSDAFFSEPRRADQEPRTDAVDAAAVDFDAPPLPLGVGEPDETRPTAPTGKRTSAKREDPEQTPTGNRTAVKRERADHGRAGRPKVPSWDDIVLGVRRNTD